MAVANGDFHGPTGRPETSHRGASPNVVLIPLVANAVSSCNSGGGLATTKNDSFASEPSRKSFMQDRTRGLWLHSTVTPHELPRSRTPLTQAAEKQQVCRDARQDLHPQ